MPEQAQTNVETRREPEEGLARVLFRLEKEAERRQGRRQSIELRWLDDLHQVHGQYDSLTREELNRAKKSRLFVNYTRAKCNALEARIFDMYFPTDDRNWQIAPTPVPELTEGAKEAATEARALDEQVAVAPAGTPEQAALQAEAARAGELAAALQAEIDEAKKRAAAMQAEIDDCFAQSKYPREVRSVIRDAVRMGTGIIKGPILDEMPDMRWTKTTATDPATGATVESYELSPAGGQTKPKFQRVDPWAYFPDDYKGANSGVFERHIWNEQALRRLARNPDFDAEAIREVLREGQKGVIPDHLVQLRAITGTHNDIGVEGYIVWEYHGPLVAEDMRALAEAVGSEELLAVIEDDKGRDDPLFEVHASVWFCNGKLLAVGLHPLDSGESIYSAFNLEEDETSPFGFGVPYIMRDPQKAMNAGWRAMMNNAALTVGPQIVVNDSAVEPADGSWELSAMKVWRKKNSAQPGVPAFEVYNIDSHQAELAGIIEMASSFIDNETGITPLSVGDGSSTVQQTAHGMTILQNALNVVFRRIIKNLDDDITEPVVKRAYHWQMQFSPKEHIKGDYEVNARGSSVLLVREIQAQNLMMIVGQFAAHPVLGPITKIASAYRKLAQSMLLSADEIVLTDDEIAEMQANAQQGPDPEMLKLEAQMNVAKMEADTRLALAQMERDTRMLELSAKMNMTIDQITAQLQKARMDIDSRERVFAAEVAIEERQAARGEQNGSGGYIS